MAENKKQKGRKPLPFSQKVTQVWTSIPMGDIVEIEKAGFMVPDFLALATREKMLRDGLVQQ